MNSHQKDQSRRQANQTDSGHRRCWLLQRKVSRTDAATCRNTAFRRLIDLFRRSHRNQMPSPNSKSDASQRSPQVVVKNLDADPIKQFALMDLERSVDKRNSELCAIDLLVQGSEGVETSVDIITPDVQDVPTVDYFSSVNLTACIYRIKTSSTTDNMSSSQVSPSSVNKECVSVVERVNIEHPNMPNDMDKSMKSGTLHGVHLLQRTEFEMEPATKICDEVSAEELTVNTMNCNSCTESLEGKVSVGKSMEQETEVYDKSSTLALRLNGVAVEEQDSREELYMSSGTDLFDEMESYHDVLVLGTEGMKSPASKWNSEAESSNQKQKRTRMETGNDSHPTSQRVSSGETIVGYHVGHQCSAALSNCLLSVQVKECMRENSELKTRVAILEKMVESNTERVGAMRVPSYLTRISCIDQSKNVECGSEDSISRQCSATETCHGVSGTEVATGSNYIHYGLRSVTQRDRKATSRDRNMAKNEKEQLLFGGCEEHKE